jgi:hypothetical protein
VISLHAYILQHLTDDLGRLLVRLEQLLALLALRLDCVVFVEELLEQVFLVKGADETVLHAVFGVVDQQVHDGFGDLVGDGLAHDIEVGGNETADELCLERLALCECGGGLGVGGLRKLVLISSVGFIRLTKPP